MIHAFSFYDEFGFTEKVAQKDNLSVFDMIKEECLFGN